MHPILVHLGPLPIHAYGFMLAVSFLVGMLISVKRAPAAGIDKNAILDLAFWVILGSIIGARLYYVLLHPEEFRGHWLDTINPFSQSQVGIGGLVMFGGLFGAILFGVVYVRIRKIPVLTTGDVIAPAVGLGDCITRIGCFLNGCCFGHCTALPWGLSFPPESPAGYFQQTQQCAAVHPSQLYESLGGLAIFFLILGIERFHKFPGHGFYLVLALYSLLRFSVDFTRSYEANEIFGGLSHNQWFCIALFCISVGGWIYGFMQSKKVNSEQ